MSMDVLPQVDFSRVRYPFCVVWTPIPMLTWLCPVLGHVGIGMSSGVIRDFAGPYYVSEDNMAFGVPTKYWQLDPGSVGANGGNERAIWDRAVAEASEEYKHRMHNLCCDNCHSHVAMALNLMRYGDKTDWTMVSVWCHLILHSRYVSFFSFVKTWLPFLILVGTVIAVWRLTSRWLKRKTRYCLYTTPLLCLLWVLALCLQLCSEPFGSL